LIGNHFSLIEMFFYSNQKNNSFAISSRRKSISSHNLSTFLIFWLKS